MHRVESDLKHVVNHFGDKVSGEIVSIAKVWICVDLFCVSSL